MRSQQLVDLFKTMVAADLASNQSIIKFFVGNNYSGGWEGWLQASYARGVFNLDRINDFNREVAFPGTLQRCDLWFQGGTGIWVELKTQRKSNYTGTVGDFAADIAKINGLATSFRQTNVLVALSVFVLSAADRTALNEIRTGGPSGTLGFYLYNNGWTDVTQSISTASVGKYVIASYRAA